MAQMLTVTEIAARWGIPETQVTRYCREGRIQGAEKHGKLWMIPSDAEKPARKKKESNGVKRPLPIGVSNYIDACTNYYYIDKTLLIKEFLDERPKVSLFTRPRRFGKTLTVDMLKTFFEISGQDHSVYFQDKKIWKAGAAYQQHQGHYPVIYLSFKDVKCDSWEETYRYLTQVIELEFIRHSELSDSQKISIPDKYKKILSGQADEADYAFSLKHLSQMLDEHYGVAPIIMIDEYDTPIQQGHTMGFYDQVVGFMRNLFSGALKDNDHLSFGFLTGILRVAKESIFSGLNNLKINSVLDNKYSQYFGFTFAEVKEMAAYYNASDKLNEIKDWYDGYRFGNSEIYNPWSVINYFGNECSPRPFWENTGNNAIISEILDAANTEIYIQLNALIQGEEITTLIDTNVIYPELTTNPSSVYSFLLVAGYLKLSDFAVAPSGDFICRVSLPNKEIAFVYKKEILNKLSRSVPRAIPIGIQQAIFSADGTALQKYIRDYLLQSVSAFDLRNENSYHMLLLGLCACTCENYYITSNGESGEGRYDIQLMPKTPKMPGILMELKANKGCSDVELERLAQKALEQIENKNYATAMKKRGIESIVKYGIAFSGKKVRIVVA